MDRRITDRPYAEPQSIAVRVLTAALVVAIAIVINVTIILWLFP